MIIFSLYLDVNVKLTFRDGNVVRYENVEGNKTLFEFITTAQNESGIEKIDFEDDELSQSTNESTNDTLPTFNKDNLQVNITDISPSFWEPLPSSSNQNSNQPINPYLIEINKEFVLKRYNNILGAFFTDIQSSSAFARVLYNSYYFFFIKLSLI